MTAIEQLAVWAAGLTWGGVPDAVRRRARWQLGAVLASTLDGPDNIAGRALLARAGETGESPVPGTDRRGTAPGAAGVAAGLATVLDQCDLIPGAAAGPAAVWPAIVLGAAAGADVDDVLTAQVAANEVMGRLGLATFIGPHHAENSVHVLAAGAAVAAGRVLGLHATDIAHALALALTEAPVAVWPGFASGSGRAIPVAQAVERGVASAIWARGGARGALDLLESPREGWLGACSWRPVPELISGLGRAWLTRGVLIKPYPCAAWLLGAVEAVRDARATFERRAGRPPNAGDLDALTLDVGLPAFLVERVVGRRAGVDNPAGVVFSIRWLAALTWIHGVPSVSNLEGRALRREQAALAGIVERTRVRHDWSLTRGFASGVGHPLGLDRAISGLGPADWARVRGRARDTLGPVVDEIARAWPEVVRSGGIAGARAAVGGAVRGAFAMVPRRLRRGREGPVDLGDCAIGSLDLPLRSRCQAETGIGVAVGHAERPPGTPGRPAREVEALIRRRLEASGTRRYGPTRGAALAALLDAPMDGDLVGFDEGSTVGIGDVGPPETLTAQRLLALTLPPP
jgi:2-methylcitrate dehydratase PrpD